MHLGEEHRARAEMVAADFRRGERFGVPHVGVADDGDVVAERLERRQAGRRQIEIAADRSRRPHVLLDAIGGAAGSPVHHLDADKPRRSGRRLCPRAASRHHGLEEGQRHRDTDPLEDRPPREMLLRDVHDRLFASLFAFALRYSLFGVRKPQVPSLKPQANYLFCCAATSAARRPDAGSVVIDILNAGLFTTPRMNDEIRF